MGLHQKFHKNTGLEQSGGSLVPISQLYLQLTSKGKIKDMNTHITKMKYLINTLKIFHHIFKSRHPFKSTCKVGEDLDSHPTKGWESVGLQRGPGTKDFWRVISLHTVKFIQSLCQVIPALAPYPKEITKCSMERN